jgi:hypothetical protein
MTAAAPRLLAIIELGGYPNFVPLYERLGFRVDVVASQRKARSYLCLLYTSPSPRDRQKSRMPSSA